MSIHSVRPCPCGSGKDSYWQLDARGIPLRRTCDDAETLSVAMAESGGALEILGNSSHQDWLICTATNRSLPVDSGSSTIRLGAATLPCLMDRTTSFSSAWS